MYECQKGRRTLNLVKSRTVEYSRAYSPRRIQEKEEEEEEEEKGKLPPIVDHTYKIRS
jgi:hypothetical protein